MNYIQQNQHTHLPNPRLPLRVCPICTIPQLFYQSSPTLTFQLIFKIHKKSAHIFLTTDVNHTCCPLIIILTHVMKQSQALINLTQIQIQIWFQITDDWSYKVTNSSIIKLACRNHTCILESSRNIPTIVGKTHIWHGCKCALYVHLIIPNYRGTKICSRIFG